MKKSWIAIQSLNLAINFLILSLFGLCLKSYLDVSFLLESYDAVILENSVCSSRVGIFTVLGHVSWPVVLFPIGLDFYKVIFICLASEKYVD